MCEIDKLKPDKKTKKKTDKPNQDNKSIPHKNTKNTKKASQTFNEEDLLKDRFLKAYKANDGYISRACEKANISRSKVYQNWLVNDPSFKEKLEEIDESFVDLGISKLHGIIKHISVKKPSREAVTVLLEYIRKKGVKRGFGDIPQDQGTDKNKIDQIVSLLNPKGLK